MESKSELEREEEMRQRTARKNVNSIFECYRSVFFTFTFSYRSQWEPLIPAIPLFLSLSFHLKGKTSPLSYFLVRFLKPD